MVHRTYRTRDDPAPCGPGVIRDDRAGTLTAGLTREIDAAHRLLESADLLADDVAFQAWTELFAEWRTCCGERLRRYSPERLRRSSIEQRSCSIFLERNGDRACEGS